MKEEWRDVVGFEGLYEVSDQGRLRNSRTLKMLKLNADPYGFLRCQLSYAPYRSKQVMAHLAVLRAFVGDAPVDAPEGRHRNRNRSDNRLANLVWRSRSSNRKKEDSQ